MEKDYRVVDSSSKLDSRELAQFLSKEGQLLLPLLDLNTQGQRAIDEVIDVMGRATIEAILKMSAEQLAGQRQQGKASDRPFYWHGTQSGRVALAERHLESVRQCRRTSRDRALDHPPGPSPRAANFARLGW